MKLPHLLTALLLSTAVAASATTKHSLFRGNHPNANRAKTALRSQLKKKASQYAVRDLAVISSDDVRRVVYDAELEDTVSIPWNITTGDGSVFGGISGITYDDDREVYYAITNDVWDNQTQPNPDFKERSGGYINISDSPLFDKDPDYAENYDGTRPPSRMLQEEEWVAGITYPPPEFRPRFYTLTFDDDGATNILAVTYLKDDLTRNDTLPLGTLQPQAIAYADGHLYIAFEPGPLTPRGTPPQIAEYNRTGHYQANFTYPSYFRFQTGFTALAINPDEHTLYAATGQGLVDDRPEYIRITEFDLDTRKSGAQYVYEMDDPKNQVVGLVSLDENGGFAVLERSEVVPHYNPDFVWPLPLDSVITNSSVSISRTNSSGSISRREPSDWEGYNVTLYYALTLDALNVESVNDLQNVDELPTIRRTVAKEFYNVSKMEAMGPDGEGRGRRHQKPHAYSHHSHSHSQDRQLSDSFDAIDVILMSDNEFKDKLNTTALFVELDVNKVPILKPEVETDEVLDDGSSGKVAIDPAIWIHPNHGEDSLILGALSMRDIGVYNLEGELKQRVGNDGDSMGLDVMYAFRFADDNMMDLALVTDGTNQRLRAYKIDPDTDDDNYLIGITDGNMPQIDKPTGVAAYHSPFTGKQYAFVISNGDHIHQLELQPTNDNERVTGSIVREIELPSSAGGLVVDNELGFLYVSLQDNKDKAVIKYDAEPNEYKDSDNFPKTIVDGGEDFLESNDIEGLTLYYGDKGDGYLVVSVSGDSTFAVFEREKENKYYDSFTIGANRDDSIDKTDNTEGVAITNVKLGSEFRCGVFVVQDFNNERAKVDGLDRGELVNSNTNFKLVPFEELADNLYYYLDVDTDSWNPRRFSLVIWVNCLAQDVYSALNEDNLSGRDTQKLLDYLNDAVRHLYPRSSKKQQMISLIDPFEQKRRRLDIPIEERRQATRQRIRGDKKRTPEERRSLKKSDCYHRHGRSLKVDTNDAKEDMRHFIEHLEALKDDDRVRDEDYNTWKDLAESIKDNIPDEK